MSQTKFDLVLSKMRELASENELLELAVMEKYRKPLSDHFDSCVAYIADMKLPKKETLDGIGYNFHKGLRQFDVTNSGKTDMIIWNYLSGNKCCFWDAFRVVDLGI